MLNVTQEYLEAINSLNRAITTRVTFNGTVAIEDDIIHAKVDERGQSTEHILIGDLCSNSATVKFVMPSEVIPLENGYFTLEHGVLVGEEYQYVDLGTYYISQIETVEGSNKYTVTGYDKSTRLNMDYVPTITLPSNVEAIVRDVCTQCNISLDGEFAFPTIEINTIYEATCKDTIRYMAGLMGKNAKINRNGDLTFYWYTDVGYQISQDAQYMSGFKLSTDEDIKILSLTSGSEDNAIVSGDGRGITFVNPYVTQELLDIILESVTGFTYTPSTTQYRGNPAIEIGDVVSIEDKNGNYHNVIVGEHEIILTGMRATVTANGKTEVEVAMSKSPTEIKINKMYQTLQSAFKESTELITGARGGYFVITKDENGYPTGFQIMDTPTLTDNTKLWMFNKNGLGFSENGGVTIKNIAIDLLGNINANTITTGVIRGDYFELDLSSGFMTLGQRGDDGTFTQKWLTVDNTGMYLAFPENGDFASKEDVNAVDSKAEEIANTLDTNFTFDENGIGIGKGDFKVNVTPTELNFMADGVKVAYISNSKLYITQGQFTDSLAMGKDELIVYEWVVRSNKHLTLRLKKGSE